MTSPRGPVGTAAVESVPHGRTALRLEWRFLPKELRALIEDELGGPVVEAVSQTSGFTPGFASVLTAANGNRSFVKAASKAAQAEIAASYAEEARKLVLLGDQVPSPALEWFSRDETWVVLGFEAVTASTPRRPWRPAELERALDLVEAVVESTETLPEGLGLQPLHADVPALLTSWDDAPADWPHRAEAAALAANLPAVQDGGRFVHGDLRDDNVLLLADGRALACDWNWPALGPRWHDSVDLLIAAHGDGLDADEVLARRELTRDADPDAVDSWLAALCGFMIANRQRPVRSSSPHLVTHSTWYAEAAWSWLARRRGWT
ncbi:MAG: phosphotransferase [Marmoricola sp.]